MEESAALFLGTQAEAASCTAANIFLYFMSQGRSMLAGHSQQSWNCLAAPSHFFAVCRTLVLDTSAFSPLGNSFLHV